MINLSKNLRIKHVKNNWFVFDNQYGNMMKVSPDVVCIMDQIKKGLSIRQIEQLNGINNLTSLLKPLIKNNLLLIDTSKRKHNVNPENENNVILLDKNNPFLNRRPTFRFYMSHLCTMKCRYCHMRHSDKKNPSREKMMFWHTAKMALDNIFYLVQKNNIQWIRISLYGGEPLTNVRVIEKMLTYTEKRYRSICDIETVMNTNGTVMNEEIVAILNHHDVDVHISLDGITNATNQHRLLKSGRPSLDRVLKNIDFIMNSGCRVQLDTCITKENMDHLQEVVDFAHNRGIKRIHLALADTVHHDSIDESLMAAKVVQTYKYAREKNVSLFGPWFKIFNSLFIDHSKVGHMGHHLINLIIKPSGHFFIFPYPDKEIGKIDELPNILRLPAYIKIREKWQHEMSLCHGCDIRMACKSYCKSMVMYHTVEQNGFERECRFTKHIIDLLMADSDIWKNG